MSEVGTCSKCDETKTLVNKKKHQCQECAYGKYKDMTSEQVVELRSHMKSRVFSAKRCDSKAPTKAHSDVEIYIDFKNDKELLASIRKRAEKSRRPLGAEILYLLDNNTITIIRDGIERLRKFKNADPHTIDLIMAKLDEIVA